MSAAAEAKKELSAVEILNKAAQSAMRGGAAGAVAMGLNVGALMWMRTTVRAVIILFLWSGKDLNSLIVASKCHWLLISD